MDVIPTNRAAPPSAAREFYRAYLNTSDWRSRRNRALSLAQWRCSKCTAKSGLEVHHKTYERLGREWDSDLEVLCQNCHRSEHLDHPDQTSLGVYLELASEAVRRDPFASIADLSEAMKRRCVELKIPLRSERVHSALAVVCGNRLKTQPPQTVKDLVAVAGRPATKGEARDFVFRLDLASRIKPMPCAKPSTIDIYGPVPRTEVEHDEY